jgi:hypothetical protein
MMGNLMMGDPSKYTREIEIFTVEIEKGKAGNKKYTPNFFEKCWANIKTTKAHTLFMKNSNYEKAYTRFLVPYFKELMDAYYEGTENSNRAMWIKFEDYNYVVQYLHDVDNMHIEIEIETIRWVK